MAHESGRGHGSDQRGKGWLGGQTIEQNMMEQLSDGEVHSLESLAEHLYEDSRMAMQTHVSNLRRQLRPIGQDIACIRVNGCCYFQLVRLTASPYNGKR